MTNIRFHPPLPTEKAAPKVIRFVYKKLGLVVFLCPLIHTNKIVTIQPPNIAKISLGECPNEQLLIEQEIQHDYHTSLPAKRTAYIFLFHPGNVVTDQLRKTAQPRPVRVFQRRRQ